jgi:hypothetical protein
MGRVIVCAFGRAGADHWEFDLSPTANMEVTESNISRTVPAMNARGSEFSVLVFISVLLTRYVNK